MKKLLITYTEEQLAQITALLDGITITRIQNAKHIAVIAQTLDSGIPAEVMEEKEGEENDNAAVLRTD